MALPTVTAENVYVRNRDTAEVYYTKAETTSNVCASMCKNMTAHILLGHYSTRAALEAVDVTVSAEAAALGGTTAGLQTGDVWDLWQLLVGMMLPSGNDAAYAIAEHLAANDIPAAPTDVTGFVAEMNSVAASLGMDDTTYVTPHGNESSHDTTAADQAIIWTQISAHAVMREIWEGWDGIVMTITRSGEPANVDLDSALGASFHEPLGVKGAKGGTGGGRHLSAVLEMGNGEDVEIITLDASSSEARRNDFAAIVAELQVDFPELAFSYVIVPWVYRDGMGD